jgi:hypothetical protein
MSALQKGAYATCMALGKKLGHALPVLREDAEVRGAEAIETIADLFGHLFPGLQD